MYNRALKARVLLRQQFLEALRQVDVLVSATRQLHPKHTALTAPFVDADDVRSRFLPACLYGLLCLDGAAGISIPCGFTTDNLPIGLQLALRPLLKNFCWG